MDHDDVSIEGDTIYVAVLLASLLANSMTIKGWSRSEVHKPRMGNTPASVVVTHESGVKHRITVERIEDGS